MEMCYNKNDSINIWKEVFAMGMEKAPAKIDMLHGSLWDKLPRFALPVAATAILEQLFNASDIAIVGNFSNGDKTVAVAAVGQTVR